MSNNIVQLAEIRLSRSPMLGKRCEHKNLVFSQPDRRIQCKDCDEVVEAFDAFMVLVRHWEAMSADLRRKARKADEAMQSTVIRRAAKELDRMWSGRQMAPLCPHCRGGLLPEDFAEVASSISADLERARRKRQASHD